MSSRSRANTGQRPARSPSAASLRRTRASSATSSPAAGSRAAKAGRTAGTPVGSVPASVTCRPRQRRLVSSSRARPAISAGDMLARRRAYHRRFTPPRLRRPPGRAPARRTFAGHGLQATAAQAAAGREGGQGGGHQRRQRDGHGPRLGDGPHEGVQLLLLALVDAGAGAADMAAATAPQLGALEVVQPGHLAVPGDLEQLLGRAGVAGGLVGDGGDRPVGVQQRARGVIGVAGGGGEHRDRVLVEPPRDGVDEVASLPHQARALLGVGIPAPRIQPPGVDVVADLQRPAPAPEGTLEVDQQRREAAVEADHQAVVAAVADRRQDRLELVRVDRQGLLDEHRLASLQGLAHHRRVRMVAGGDQHGVDRLVGQQAPVVGGASLEAELALGVGCRQPGGGRHLDQPDVGPVAQVGQEHAGGVVAGPDHAEPDHRQGGGRLAGSATGGAAVASRRPGDPLAG